MRVLHVITGPLLYGGAEVMLRRLVGASRPALSHEVVSLTTLGPVADEIAALGVPVRALGMPRTRLRLPDPMRLARLVGLVRGARPDVVQTWLYHADLLGGVAARLAGGARIFWGLHNSTLDPTRTRRTTRWTMALCARLSRVVPDGIVSVSAAARDLHVAAGYDPRRFVVIPNGFDLAQLRPDPAARREVRAALGVGDGDVVIGMIARVDPQKDHAGFVRAAALLARRRPDVRFLLCGEGATAENAELGGLLAAAGVRDRVLLLGRRSDVPRMVNALDLCTLSSAYGEAFPLSIGEAMACEVPCVVTDLGDCGHLVGDAGRVVPPRDPEALAAAWEALVALGPEGRRTLGRAARARIAERFDLRRVAEAYEALYRRVPGAAAAVVTVTER
jgi:glycosyltransferase involved in cell wall biosynthesis